MSAKLRSTGHILDDTVMCANADYVDCLKRTIDMLVVE